MHVPFDLLHTFIVAARAQRLSDAADILGVTAGAVSQRIRGLEARIGRRLFERGPRGVTMTAAGRALFRRVSEPMTDIEAAFAAASSGSRQQQVVVSMTPSFAANWLIKRLNDFKVRHRGIEITVEASTRTVDMHAEPIDLAIRHGLGRYPGLFSQWLMAPEQIVVGSPKLLGQGRSLARPLDCLKFPLLHDIERQDWALWLEALGEKADVPPGGHAFSDDNLLIKAAVAGQGLALVFNTYAAEEIGAGRLVQPYNGSWPTKFAYYLVGPPRAFKRPAVKRFAKWLAEEAAQEDSVTAKSAPLR